MANDERGTGRADGAGNDLPPSEADAPDQSRSEVDAPDGAADAPDRSRSEADAPDGAGSGPPERACEEPDCEGAAAVRLHVPWSDDRLVCAAHARSLARRDGVVAEPLESAAEEFP